MFDVTEVTSAITLAAAAVAAIGGAVVAGPAIARAAWRWIRGTVS